MRHRRQQWVGVVVLGTVIAVGYIRNRDNNGSLLASVVGDYSESAVSYVMDMDQHILSLMGDVGGESVLTIIILYDPDRVQLISVDTNYQYIVQDDDMGLIRVELKNLPTERYKTGLVQMTWDGAMESVVVSDIGFDIGGVFRTIPVSNNSLCFGNACEHDA